MSQSNTPVLRGRLRALCAIASCALALVVAAPAHADPRTEYIIKQLKSDDFKVRTQAALALGASGDPTAVAPLCGALHDSNTSVKVAAAAALGKLGKPEGGTCLKSARPAEKDSSVLAQIDQSLEKMGEAAPTISANTKYYVAIQVTNKTSRSDAEIDGVVRAAAAAKLNATAGYVVAPKSETPSAGGDVIKSKKLKGILLIASIGTPTYSGGMVSIAVNSTLWTYPDKNLKATVNATRKTEAAGATDIEGENALIQALSEDAANKLIASAAKL